MDKAVPEKSREVSPNTYSRMRYLTHQRNKGDKRVYYLALMRNHILEKGNKNQSYKPNPTLTTPSKTGVFVPAHDEKVDVAQNSC